MDEWLDIDPQIQYFVDRSCPPTWQLLRNKIPFHDLNFIYAGEAIYTIDGTTYHLKAGDLLYAPPGSIREAVTDKQNLMSCYDFNFKLPPHQSRLKLPFKTVTTVGLPEELLRLYQEFTYLWLEKEPGYKLKAKGLFLQILHQLIYPGDKTNRLDWRIVRIKEYLLKHYQEKIKIADLAKLVNLSPVYCGALFKKQTGLSIKAYLNQIRIQKACDLLATGEYNVSEVAAFCGFDDLFYFSKVFKRVTGMAPSFFK